MNKTIYINKTNLILSDEITTVEKLLYKYRNTL